MAGPILPAYGGAWIPDTGGGGGDDVGGKGHLPTGLMEMLEKFGKNGIVISGVVTWIGAQIDTQTNDAWMALAERSFKDNEISEGKEALRLVKGDVLENLVTDFKLNRKGGSKKEREIDDIRKALLALQAAGDMPLVMASSGQMVRCPQSWGVPLAATVQDVMGKVIMLEQVMADSMKSQKENMQVLREELQASRRVEPRTPSFPEIRINDETPSKKRKKLADDLVLEDSQQQVIPGQQSPNSYAKATLLGVQPLDQNQQRSIRMIQDILKPQQQNLKPQRNICYGSAKTTGVGTAGSETLLAADVSLVASGVGKGCTEEKLKEFLVGKGINPVEVEMLTKQEVIENVRTLTFRVAVKAAEYEASLKPEVWPYRVAVRHYKAPRRDRSEGTWQGQSERSGGQINRHGRAEQGGGQPAAGGGRQERPHLPPGHPGRVASNQQMRSQPSPSPIQLSNLYSALAALNGEMGPITH